MSYAAFLESKRITAAPSGIKRVPPLNSALFPFQCDIVKWALKRGKSAIFADCGMGKTLMQLEWARVISEIEGPVLILAPLAVAQQTVEEGKRFGISVYYERKHPEQIRGITITNYEMLEHFDAGAFSGVVLDESSILKSYDGKTRTAIIESFKNTPYKLACTATPAPNDFMELGNHSEFLNIMGREEMLSMFFVHDGGETQKWRLKGHARNDFWQWVASWAVNVRKPSDLGYDDGDFKLPELTFKQHSVDSGKPLEGMLFSLPASTLQERIQARRESVGDRAEKIAEIVATDKGQWLIWCNLNSEAETARRLIPGAVEVRGSDSIEHKRESMLGFSAGKIRVLITKPSIAGFGMNWQNCHNVAFLGLSDSYEEFYQAIRRCWRFGQKSAVTAHIVIAQNEGAVLKNIRRKERESGEMANEMVKFMKDIQQEEIKGASRERTAEKQLCKTGANFAAYLGDCVTGVSSLKAESIHYSIFSPPFASLYTYSNSEKDMGNSKNGDEFAQHFGFLVKELFRVLMVGRLVSFHCMNLPTSKTHHGFIGIRDFRGEMIRLFESAGFIFHSEVCIWKDPVTAMQRTKALGLLHKQLKKDSCMSRQGIPDYLVTMRKPGDNPERVTHTNEEFPVLLWQKYASPVWMDINPSDTLQFRSAREHDDERHICPLQLQVIQRGIELWSNPGDVVLSPFMGIGSEGYMALKLGRKFTGYELKESYYNQAVKNLESVDSPAQKDLFIGMEMRA